MDTVVLFNLLCLLQMSLVSFSLPIVDSGLFVIMGVRSCRSGDGYCMLGLDCTLDEDFLPDDEGGHCDGLRSAFTPSAHFICCKYNIVNKTEAKLPHIGEPPDITSVFSEQLSTSTSPSEIQTTTFEQTSDIPTSTIITVTETNENQPLQARIELDDFTDNTISNKILNKVKAEIEIRVNDKKNQSKERDVDDSDERIAVQMRTEVSVSVGKVTKTISRRDATTRTSVTDIFSSTTPSVTSSETQNIQSSVVSERTQEGFSDTSPPTIFDMQSDSTAVLGNIDETTHISLSGDEIMVQQSYPSTDLDNSVIPVTTQKTKLIPENNEKSNIDNDVITQTKAENEISKKASDDQIHNKNYPKDVSGKNNGTNKIKEDIKTSSGSKSQPVGDVTNPSVENRFTTSREDIASFLSVSEDTRSSTTVRNGISPIEEREKVDDQKVKHLSSSSGQDVHTHVITKNVTHSSQVPSTILETKTENSLKITPDIFSEETNFPFKEQDYGNTIPSNTMANHTSSTYSPKILYKIPLDTTENSLSTVLSDKITERYKDTPLQDASSEKQEDTSSSYHTSTENTSTESFRSATSLDTTQQTDIHITYFTSTEMDRDTTLTDTTRRHENFTISPAFIGRHGVTDSDTTVKSSSTLSDTTRESYSTTTETSHTGIEIDRTVTPTNVATNTQNITTTERKKNIATTTERRDNKASTTGWYKDTVTPTEKHENATTAKIHENTATTTGWYKDTTTPTESHENIATTAKIHEKNTATTLERHEDAITTVEIHENTATTTVGYKDRATTTERHENATTAKIHENAATTTGWYKDTATPTERHENTEFLGTTRIHTTTSSDSNITAERLFPSTTKTVQLNTFKNPESMTSTESHGSAPLTDAIERHGILNSDISAETDDITMVDTTTESYERSADTASGRYNSATSSENPLITVSSDKTTERPIYTTYTEKTTEKPIITVTSDKTTERPIYTTYTEKPAITVSSDKTTERPIYTTYTEKPIITVTSDKTTERPIYTTYTEKPAITVSSDKTTERPIYTTYTENTTEKPIITVSSDKTTERPTYITYTEKPIITVSSDKTTERPIYTTYTEKPAITVSSDKTTERPIYTTYTQKPTITVSSDKTTGGPTYTTYSEKTTEKPKITSSYKTTERPISTVISDKTTGKSSSTIPSDRRPSNTSSDKLTESHGTTTEISGSVTPETACGKMGSQNNSCWLVGFMNSEDNNNLMCVGSYLDSKTIISSANCLSRIFYIGVPRVALLSAGGAMTSPEMIHDVVVQEEYRNKGFQVLLNDIGLVRLKPESKLPPAACALCLPSSEQELMDKPCDATEWLQDDMKHIGSPMVCQGRLLAGITSSYNPDPVYTPISDYLTWIRTNQIIHYDTDGA